MSGENFAELTTPEGKTIQLPVVESTQGIKGIDISSLKKEAGYISYDNGFANTAPCVSSITYIDGEKGKLYIRGYDMEDLVEKCTFTEVAHLLVHGTLPTQRESKRFSSYLNKHSMIHENMQYFFQGYPADSHPMLILASMIASLESFYPQLSHKDPNFDITAARLISKVRTIAAFSYKKSRGHPVVYPKYGLSYCANFLNMMFSSPVNVYEIDPLFVKILNQLLILHVDHSQNCSTSAVKLIGSARASLYAALSAGIYALWGPLHGGANQAVIEMLNKIKNDSRNLRKYLEKAKDREDPFRLMGFGHAVYKNYDPRAKVAKKICVELVEKRKISEPLLEIALELEEMALNDPYFREKRLFPNVDFYSGIIYKSMGIPTNMLTVMFVIGRLPGWIAQWKEQRDLKSTKIFRPKQVYTGPENKEFIEMQNR